MISGHDDDSSETEALSFLPGWPLHSAASNPDTEFWRNLHNMLFLWEVANASMGDSQESYAGVPAVPIDEWREVTVLLRRLPELRAAVAALEARLAALETQLK